ncbi:MAG: monovalent cation/H+ antiporter subunit D family protein [Acidimicrobiales bacterium]
MSTLAPLPVAVPLLMAALLVGLGPVIGRRLSDAIGVVTAAGVTVMSVVLLHQSLGTTVIHWFGGWTPHGGVALGIAFVVDPLGAGAAALAGLLVTLALVFSWRSFDAVGTLFSSMMLVFLAAMSGFCLTGDLFNLFVFFELMSVTAFGLTAYKIEDAGPLEGSLNFAVSNSVGAYLILMGIALVYARTGALNLAQIGRALGTHPADGLVVCAFVLITGGFLIKGAIVPFHFWLADAHAVAPTPVCVLFSGVMVELGLYGAVRVFWTIFAPALQGHLPAVTELWLFAGTATAVLGAVMCATQHHLKRLLAFSTISHMGMVLIGAALLSPAGLAGAAIYVLGHAGAKAALFLVVGIVLHRLGSVDEFALRGRGRPLVGSGLLFLLGGIALAGCPPFATYLGKGVIEDAAERAGYGFVVPLFIATSALTAGSVLRAGARVFLGWGPTGVDPVLASSAGAEIEPETISDRSATPAWMWVPAALLLGGTLALGVAPGLRAGAEAAAVRFSGSDAYAGQVLEGVRALAAPRGSIHTLGAAATNGLVSVMGAFAVAGLMLSVHRLPARAVAPLRAFARPIGLLRGLHSGYVTDYVAWITLGFAIFGGAAAATLRS